VLTPHSIAALPSSGQAGIADASIALEGGDTSAASWWSHDADISASFEGTPVRPGAGVPVDGARVGDGVWDPFRGGFGVGGSDTSQGVAVGRSPITPWRSRLSVDEFLAAVKRNDLVSMNQYAAQPTCNIHAVDHVNKNAMMFAAALRLDAALQWCVERGVGGSVDAVSDHAWTALMFACASGWGVPATRADVSTCASLLVRAGADVNHRSASGDTALHVAAHAGYRHIVAFLLSVEGVDIGVRNGRGQTAEECAVTARHHSVASMLATRSTRQ
jgi:hypothetical protein